MAKKPKDPPGTTISAKPNSNKSNDHVARLRVVQEVSSRNSSASWNSSCTFSTEHSLQDQPRPPVYNVEDYAGSLRKFARRGQTSDGNNGDSPDPKQTEMTLKEFTSITELLEKLSADLKLAYFSFVQEFVGDPIDGVTMLLELLKTIQQNGTQTKCTAANQRRITLDENACLQCLQHCLRCQDAARKLAISPAGLYTLAACIMSTVNHSRLLTLELLTKACCESGTADGHSTVSDAMSTMRLRFAEPVRFRFLVGMMSGNGSSGMELLLAGLKFINAFTETCPDLQTRFYVQAELKQAGFKPAGILKNISNKSPLLSSVSDEIYRWQKNFINVESLKRQHDEVAREAKSLREKVAMLEKKIHVLQDEKHAMLSSRASGKDGGVNNHHHHHHHHHADGPQKTQKIDHRNKLEDGGVGGGGSGGGGCGGGGNSAEDEGISSSEQDDCEDDVPPPTTTAAAVMTRNDVDDVMVAMNGLGGGGGGYNKKASYGGGLSSSQQGCVVAAATTTVDGVLEDFDRVINDASTATDDRAHHARRLRYYSSAGRDGPVVAAAADDTVIVPTRIVPEPPRRSRSLFVNKNFEVNPFFEDDEDEEEEEEEEDESGADSECAYDDEEDEASGKCGGTRTAAKRSGGGSADETFHSVQKQIERFSALALRRGNGGGGGGLAGDRDHGIVQRRTRDGDDINADLLQQHGAGRRKSIYDVFAGMERPSYGGGGARVTRSASTRNAVDSRTGPVIPRFVNRCVGGGGGNKSVYLPGGRGDANADGGDPKKAFVATRTNGVGNNAGLYSGYKDPAAAQPPRCVGFGVKSASNGSGSSSSSSKGGPKALHHVNLSVSTGKLTDFPSGLY